MNKIFYTISFCFAALFSFSQQIAFPTAEGFGRFTTGGRGTVLQPTTVFEVTNLQDNNLPGSFRYAVLASAATYPRRTIIFRVSGTIHLTSALTLSRANTTIAGQTAPGNGICIADHPFTINANNVIVRYMRFRLGDKNQNLGMVNGSGDGDGLTCTGFKNIVIDHCTMSWSNDEAFTVYRGDSTTLQWNMISEPLDYSYHFETGDADYEKHGYGGIWGGQHSTMHHNLIAHVRGRAPRFDGNRNLSTGQQERVDFRNNVIYNWVDYTTNGGEGGNYNIVNNYYKYGPNTPSSTTAGVNRRNMIIQPYKQTSSPVLPYGTYFMDGNYVDNSATITSRNWLGAAMNNGSLADTTQSKTSTPFAFDAINTQDAVTAYEYTLRLAGASIRRDTLDERIANDVRNRTGKIIDVQGGYAHGTAYATSQTAWPAIDSIAAPADTDHDGMPDDWEIRRGLNATNAIDRYAVNANGYTNLENYLNGDSIVAMGINNTCISAKAFTAVNRNAWSHIADTSYSNVIAVDTLNLIASIFDNGNYGAFNVSYYTTNTTRTANGSAYLNRNVTITPANPALITGPVTVRLYFSLAEFNALKLVDPTISSVADLAIFKQADNTCQSVIGNAATVITPTATGNFGTYANGYFIEFNTSSFSTFFIAKNTAVFPLKLLSFKGNYTGKQTQLTWQTSNEINTKNFIIERSNDGLTFTAIGNVMAKGNATVNNYNFTDDIIINAAAFYRLKMIDKNGMFVYSNAISFTNNSRSILSVNPNPVSGASINVKHAKAAKNAVITIISADGKVILQKNVAPASLTTQINISSFSKGLYMLIYYNGNERSSAKLIKQ